MTLFGIPISFKWIWHSSPPPAPWYPRGGKLGKLPAKQDTRTLRFAKYVTAEMPVAPASCDYGAKVPQWGMLGNDVLGDCTCAGILHMIMLWLSQNGFQVRFTDSDAIGLYEQLCGYVPGKPDTDQGGVELDILKAWRKSPIKGATLLGYAAVDPANWEHVKLAHWLAGTLYLGIDLPVSAQSEINAGKPWASTSDDPGGWGGHAVCTSAYKDVKQGLPCGLFKRRSSASRLTCVTWGQLQDMAPEWVAKYCDEMWVPITPQWFNKLGKAPNGFDLRALQADIAAIQLN